MFLCPPGVHLLMYILGKFTSSVAFVCVVQYSAVSENFIFTPAGLQIDRQFEHLSSDSYTQFHKGRVSQGIHL